MDLGECDVVNSKSHECMLEYVENGDITTKGIIFFSQDYLKKCFTS